MDSYYEQIKYTKYDKIRISDLLEVLLPKEGSPTSTAIEYRKYLDKDSKEYDLKVAILSSDSEENFYLINSTRTKEAKTVMAWKQTDQLADYFAKAKAHVILSYDTRYMAPYITIRFY